ncbi:MAG: hypothetical protein QF917_00110 [Candidatus Woesearchaeota archaeon]|jgi:hypothetical protein|nr:hypothetical protein [Candidatus Woesearchaeota archaeon]|tara:strand:- start:13883 stop:14284 length:402 start_codon:yes stop_codon:yes gene_type:complete
MKKRGEATLWFLVELIGAFLVAYLAGSISLAYAQGIIFEKLNIAKDLAMQINTLSSVPGEAYIINKDLHGYSLYFSDNKIEVFEDASELIKGTYHYAGAMGSNLELRLIKPEQVVISKINDEIKISEDTPSIT